MRLVKPGRTCTPNGIVRLRRPGGLWRPHKSPHSENGLGSGAPFRRPVPAPPSRPLSRPPVPAPCPGPLSRPPVPAPCSGAPRRRPVNQPLVPIQRRGDTTSGKRLRAVRSVLQTGLGPKRKHAEVRELRPVAKLHARRGVNRGSGDLAGPKAWLPKRNIARSGTSLGGLVGP